MKRAVTYTYTFTPTANTLNLSGIPSFSIVKLYAVIDLTADSIIYAAGTPGYGYSVLSGTTLTLQAPMANCQATDTLMILYDDADQALASEIVRIAFGTSLVTSGNPLPVAVDAQASGLAQDTSLQSILTAVGAIGSTPPTLPGSSSGIMGILRWLGGLLPQFGGRLATTPPPTVIATASFTRPANTTAYSSGNLVANSVTAGSVVPMSWSVVRSNALLGHVTRARLQKSGTSTTNASFTLYLFTATPATITNGDGGAFSVSGSQSYIGKIAITVTDVFTDGATGIGVPAIGSDQKFQCGGSSTQLYGLLVASAAYTPASAEVFQVTLEVGNDN
jgi:hypothetical protein